MKILLVGIGALGYKLTQALSVSDHDITVADPDCRRLEKVKTEIGVKTVKASGIEVDSLKEINVFEFDLAIVATDSDESNIICCSILKGQGCKRVVACLRDPEFVRQQAFIQEMMDIDFIVNPELAASNEIAGFLLKDFPFYNAQPAEGRFMLMEVWVSAIPRWQEKQIKDLRFAGDALVVAIKRQNETIIPTGATRIEQNDILYVFGNSYQLKDFMSETNILRKDEEIHRVMIIGGGKLGYYLATNLLKKGIKVKIIERDTERCDYLSENLSENALIINGDGSDINLLRNEEFDLMDAFIGATGHDEENLLMTLMAKRRGVGRVAARVSHSNYVSIIEQLGVDGAFSMIDITAREILRYIRGKTVLACSQFFGKEVEVTEFLVDKNMPITNRALSQLQIPEGVIFGAIQRNDAIIIPKPSTVIGSEDKLVTFSLVTSRRALKEFLGKN